MITPLVPSQGCADERSGSGSKVPRRGSARSRGVAAISSVTLRPLTKLIPPEKRWGLWVSRQIVAQTMALFGPNRGGVDIAPVDATLLDGRRVTGEWICPRGPLRGTAAIFYVHGSGYAMCSPRTHRRLASWISRLVGLPVFCVGYRLAPEHRFPAAAEDVRAGWDWLVGVGGTPADRVVIAGDSAGGHLAVDMLRHLEPGDPSPAGLVMFSPLADVTFGLAAGRERLRRDPATSADGAARLLRLYYDGVDPAHPRLALDLEGGPAMPPTLIQAGGAEMLAADAHRLADGIRACGGTCELQVWPDQVHVFQALPKLVPEAALAMEHVTEFIGNILGTNTFEIPILSGTVGARSVS